MSRYFNETSKAEKWATDALTSKLDLQDLFSPAAPGGDDAAQESEEPAKPSAVPPLILPAPQDVPLLTRRDNSMAQAAEAYRTLRTRILRLQASRKTRSIVFSSSHAGEGKTITTINLALCCAQLPKLSVLVIDADLRTRGLTRLLGCTESLGLSEVLGGKGTSSQAVIATELPNLSVVPAGQTTASPGELFATPKWKEFIDWACENYKLVLVDSPPVLPLTDFELISAGCDSQVFVIRGGYTNREMIRRASAQLDSNKLLGPVFNMALDPTPADYRGYPGSVLPLKESA
jgi:capsular exopolysaccharide synthesis family protein